MKYAAEDEAVCLVPTPPRESSLSRNTIETLLVADRDEARGQRDHARFMAAGWRRLAKETERHCDSWIDEHDREVRKKFEEQAKGDRVTAYVVRLYRELNRTRGGAVARTIMRDLLAEVPSVASSLTLREQEQIEKGEGWK